LARLGGIGKLTPAPETRCNERLRANLRESGMLDDPAVALCGTNTLSALRA